MTNTTPKRDEIVRVALELIAKYGFHGTSMAMISDEAKVGAGTIYRYFKSKDDLIIELFKEVDAKLEAKLFEAFPPKILTGMSVRERFLKLGEFLFRYSVDNLIEFKYLEQFFNSPYGVEVRRNKILNEEETNVITNLFREGVAQGAIKNLPLPVLFALAFGPLMNMVRNHDIGFFRLDDERITQVIEACWDGIKKYN